MRLMTVVSAWACCSLTISLPRRSPVMRSRIIATVLMTFGWRASPAPRGSSVVESFPHSNFIVDRAREYLTERGGRAPEEALLAHVFGQRGRADLWRALLRAALAK